MTNKNVLWRILSLSSSQSSLGSGLRFSPFVWWIHGDRSEAFLSISWSWCISSIPQRVFGGHTAILTSCCVPNEATVADCHLIRKLSRFYFNYQYILRLESSLNPSNRHHLCCQMNNISTQCSPSFSKIRVAWKEPMINHFNKQKAPGIVFMRN
jgi:hypothetical protein